MSSSELIDDINKSLRNMDILHSRFVRYTFQSKFIPAKTLSEIENLIVLNHDIYKYIEWRRLNIDYNEHDDILMDVELFDMNLVISFLNKLTQNLRDVVKLVDTSTQNSINSYLAQIKPLILLDSPYTGKREFIIYINNKPINTYEIPLWIL